ncbi:type IV pilus biogenesis protein PilP [Desulfovibrio sp. ZJ200]|uniref:type IV pilus biogenesis protein PilP n=1 Tax=Desulfovibrio sp. ZJ200 TaxID=2709792 RepID=UPI0013EA06A2|nr:type IV pilus biogenesis protein PilP [Desulfovibrio sp. ZJ200]
MPFTKRKALLALGGCIVVCAATTGGFFLVQQQGRPAISAMQSKATPPTLKPATAPAAAMPSTLKSHATPTPAKQAMSAEQDKAKPGEQVRAALNNSETRLGDLARMRGQKHLLEQQVKIAELEQKLKEARSAVAPAPGIVLPPLEPPVGKTQETKPLLKPSGPVVLSVQGVAGRLSATIRTSSGEVVTVAHGRRFGGGVLSVTRDSVLIRTGSSTRVVPFKE